MTAVAPEQASSASPVHDVHEAHDVHEVRDQPDDLVLADLLVEEISIDGMCGVY